LSPCFLFSAHGYRPQHGSFAFGNKDVRRNRTFARSLRHIHRLTCAKGVVRLHRSGANVYLRGLKSRGSMDYQTF
jgi:hypothetical protein